MTGDIFMSFKVSIRRLKHTQNIETHPDKLFKQIFIQHQFTNYIKFPAFSLLGPLSDGERFFIHYLPFFFFFYILLIFVNKSRLNRNNFSRYFSGNCSKHLLIWSTHFFFLSDDRLMKLLEDFRVWRVYYTIDRDQIIRLWKIWNSFCFLK